MSHRLPEDEPLDVGTYSFSSRLFLGTGKYPDYSCMRDCLEISGTECVTVAVRRLPEDEPPGEAFWDFLDRKKFTILPNTAGCFDDDEQLCVHKR